MFILIMSLGIFTVGSLFGWALASTQFEKRMTMNAYERMNKRDYEKFKELLKKAARVGGK